MAVFVHYKNGLRYEMIGEARHSETQEEMIVYRALYGDGQIWVRAKAMFYENVAPGVPRFKLESQTAGYEQAMDAGRQFAIDYRHTMQALGDDG